MKLLWTGLWMNEWMKSYIAHVSSRRLFRALYIESNLARPVIIQIPTQSPGRYTAELPLRRIKLFSFQANSPYQPLPCQNCNRFECGTLNGDGQKQDCNFSYRPLCGNCKSSSCGRPGHTPNYVVAHTTCSSHYMCALHGYCMVTLNVIFVVHSVKYVMKTTGMVLFHNHVSHAVFVKLHLVD